MNSGPRFSPHPENIYTSHQTPRRSNSITAAMEEESHGGDGVAGAAGKPIGVGVGVGDEVNSREKPKVTTFKGKSCKGCLYYSSLRKADARNPICFGISKTYPRVPDYIVGESEVEATKEGRSLTDFKYSCVGYSVYKDNTDDKQENRAELPFCAGIELLVDRRSSSADHVPAHVHNKEDGTVVSQPRPHKPAHSAAEEFIGRFKRNAGLVASGVARNVNIVGSYVKDNLDDIMYPYRRRPK